MGLGAELERPQLAISAATEPPYTLATRQNSFGDLISTGGSGRTTFGKHDYWVVDKLNPVDEAPGVPPGRFERAAVEDESGPCCMWTRAARTQESTRHRPTADVAMH